MKIAVTCGPTSASFLTNVERCLAFGGHEVRRFIGKSAAHIAADLRAWRPDAVFHEWLDTIAVELAAAWNGPLVVRCHRYEVWTANLDRMPWDREKLRVVFTCPDNFASAKQRCSRLAAVDARVIPELVDLSHFRPRERSYSTGGDIGWASYLHPRKDPILALHVLDALRHDVPDVAWHLHVAGMWQDECLRESFLFTRDRLGLYEHVTLDGWIDEMAAWWATKDACLVTSWSETGPLNAIEAMACGVWPVVRDHPGARERFPVESVWRTVDEAVAILARWPRPDVQTIAAMAERFSLTANREKVCALFEDFA